jgi:hypothetical protein
MKVTICFDEVKVIVPCSTFNSSLRVADLIENAISRYKKATGKVRFAVFHFNF